MSISNDDMIRDGFKAASLLAFLYGYIYSMRRSGELPPHHGDHLLRKIREEYPREWNEDAPSVEQRRSA